MLRQHQAVFGLLAGFDSSLRLSPASIAVLQLLFELTLWRAVVLGTSVDGIPLAVCFSATKWTPEVLTAGVAWMGREENPTVTAACQTPPQTWIGPKHGPKHKIVLQREIPDFTAVVPARLELEMLLDFYDQKPSVSLMMLIRSCTASSYTIGTPCVER